jgi:hypothetical protein
MPQKLRILRQTFNDGALPRRAEWASDGGPLSWEQFPETRFLVAEFRADP